MSSMILKKEPGYLKQYSDLTPDQQAGIARLYETDHTFLIGDMGAGKTVVSATAISELLRDGVLKRVLIVAPLKVCQQVWRSEPYEWSHLQHWSAAFAIGSEAERIAAVESDAPVVVINFENLAWLCKRYKKAHGFDGLLVDEITRFKSGGGTTLKALRPLIKTFAWRVGMTGTAVSENFQGLYGQVLVIDGGERLGTRKDQFLRNYFYPTDFNGYNWALLPGGDVRLTQAISDLVHVLPDYRHELPPLDIVLEEIDLPEQARDAYEYMAKHFLLKFDDGDAEAPNSAVVSAKLQQISNGFVYTENGNYEVLHTAKFDRLEQLLADKVRTVVCYWHQYELAELQRRFPHARVLGSNAKHNERVLRDWREGRGRVLLIHPKSAGHGLDDLKYQCSRMIFVAPIWSGDYFNQTIARLWRRGQTDPVEVVLLVGVNTVDELVWDRVHDEKGQYEGLLRDHLKSC